MADYQSRQIIPFIICITNDNNLVYIIKGCAKNPWFWIFVLLISQLLYIGSLKSLCLPHIIRDKICGVGTRMLKIRFIEAELWAKQKFKNLGFLSSPFIILLFRISFVPRQSWTIVLPLNLLLEENVWATTLTNYQPELSNLSW